MPDRDEADRPVHLVHDIPAGTETYIPVSDQEWDEHEIRALQSQRDERDRLAQQQADDALIRERAQADPAFAALVRKNGGHL